MSCIKVRFAPSPTGYLHVGGARTAIFNWLFAQKHCGKFLLRIEDTDKKRSSEEMVQQILRSLSWLGLKHDGNVYYQSEHINEHKKIAEQLLNFGKAYRCFCDDEEIKRKKQQAVQEKKSDKYDRTCLKLNSQEIDNNLKSSKSFVIRLKIDEGYTIINDSVLGKIKIKNKEIDDFVLIRSDGTPVYHLAVVVDDYNMGITHVIRGNDHLSNTAKQIQIYKTMQWIIPQFAHLPLIMGEDNKRLSKRHRAASVDEFRNKGILTNALFNYLSLLGWSTSEDNEIFSKEELTNKFSLKDINKKSAIFDEKKLYWMNGQYISALPDEEILEYLKHHKYPEEIKEKGKNYLLKTISLIKSKIKTIDEFYEHGFYFFQAPKQFDEKGLKKHFKNEETINWIEQLFIIWKENNDFNPQELENELRILAEKLKITAAKLIHPIRLIVTGGTVSPSLFEMLQLIGKHEVIKRIEWFLKNNKIKII